MGTEESIRRVKDKARKNSTMRMHRKWFGVEVGEIIRAGDMGNTELIEVNSTLHPMQAHVDRFTHFDFE